ncbi:MAG: peptidase-C39 like family protein [Deltaproteobacteria bacterium]|nr:peptidase-C39 like family protein [Deltaproteobacteria bacterium]
MHLEDRIRILAQPDGESCGATCLEAVYRYCGLPLEIQTILTTLQTLPGGGTLAPYMGTDARRHSLQATITPYDTRIFDPSWSSMAEPELAENLRRSREYRLEPRTIESVDAYIEFLAAGGKLLFAPLSPTLLTKMLEKGPIIAGLNATYLYGCAREFESPHGLAYDAVRGQTLGHFVVIVGIDICNDAVSILDPQLPNPISATQQLLRIPTQLLLSAILLGALTYDSALLQVRHCS